MRFQQDGPTSRESTETMLQHACPNQLIDRFRATVLFQATPEYLTALDFFPSKYLEERVYSTNPTSLQNLKPNIKKYCS